MVIYLDLVFIINFIFDFLLLLTINIALKRYKKIRRLILGSLFGSLSLITLILPISSIYLIFFKIILGLIMVLVTFGYKNLRYTLYNLAYLYMTSIILGGFLYYLKTEFSYNHKGFIFYYEGLAINYIFLIIIAPLILVLFIKNIKVLKEVKNYYYQVEIKFQNETITLTGFLDTGNKLKDPITNKYIILINKKLLKNKINIRSPMYVPFNSLNHHGLLECFKPDKLIIEKKEVKNYLIGLADSNFKLNGIDCLLNYHIWEEFNV